MFSLLEVVYTLVHIVGPQLLMNYTALVKWGTDDYTFIAMQDTYHVALQTLYSLCL